MVETSGGSRHSLDLTVIIPFRDQSAMTMECVRTFDRFGPLVRELLLVSNSSSKEHLERVRAGTADMPAVTIVEYNEPFNYQKLCNWSAERASAGMILFLNNDTELVPESVGLLERMFAKASEPDVGITGCLLLYGDRRTIQHAGVFLVPRGHADHLYVGRRVKDARAAKDGRFPYDIGQSRPLTAVTGAASMIERKKFEKIGGFDERFIMCGGDVDLCIRLNGAGFQTWYVDGGHIIHKESQSRRFKPIPYSDFYFSYLSYSHGYDPALGDPFLPEITKADTQ